MKIRTEWVHEGDYLHHYVRDNVPFLPTDRPLGRIHLASGKIEGLRNDDPSWTVTRWVPSRIRVTTFGDVLLFDENWSVFRLTHP